MRSDHMRGFADRLVSYADALTALSFLSVSGLGIAAADPDARCSLALTTVPVAGSNIVFAILATMFILKLRSWEQELRSESEFTDRAIAIARYLHFARLTVIWLSAGLTVLVLYAISQDPNCASPAV